LGRAGAELSPDPTGLWYDPAESGWGLAVAQQGGEAFAVLFVYDQAGRPTWYFASDLNAPALNPMPPGGVNDVDGILYRAAGPWFGGTFDPGAVTVTPVGSLGLTHLPGQQSLKVGYTIDGTAYSKTVQPQTWGSNAALLVGTFEGGLSLTGKSPADCEDVHYGPVDPTSPFDFSVRVDGPQLTFTWVTGIDTSCVASGRYTQSGQLGSIDGALQCITSATLSNPVPPAPLQLSGLAITGYGFAGAATVQRGNCVYTGHFGGVRRLSPDFGGR
jgi:hypothetical protein